jgi:hypothetical protein
MRRFSAVAWSAIFLAVSELGRDLGAADHRCNRALRRFQRLAQRFQLGLHQPAGRGRQQMGDRLDRGMGAVRAGEGVIHVEVAELGQALGELRVVGLFLLVVAQVLQKRDLAILERCHHFLGFGPDAIGGEGDTLAAQRLADFGSQALQRIFRVRLALRAAEMGHQHHLGAAVEQLFQGRRQALDAGGVGYLAVLRRDVQVGADQHPLAGDIDLVERTELNHRIPQSSLG